MLAKLKALFNSQESGLALIILVTFVVLTLKSGSHINFITGQRVNNFMNPDTLLLIATDASIFAMGSTAVIVSGGIDLSVGAVYALAGVCMALTLRAMGPHASALELIVVGLAVCVGVGVLSGLLNGIAITALDVHPFIITLGTMWALRGVAFVSSRAESILLPDPVVNFMKADLGLRRDLHPMPMIVMFLIMIVGAIYLTRTVAGRRTYAVGGSSEASRYAGLNLNRILIGVYVLSGLTAGIAAFVGNAYYGSSSCGDATGYELYVIAAAVVGGASLSGGRGSAIGAMLGALLIVLIRQAIRTLHFDTNYEQIIIGLSIVIAVVVDRWQAKLRQRRLLAAQVRT